MKNKERIEILNKRVDTLYDLVAYIQKHTQAGIKSIENLNLDPNGDNEAEVIEQAMTNVARKSEIEDQWLNVLIEEDVSSALLEYSITKALNKVIYKKIKPLIDENIRLKEQNENLDIAYMAGLSDGKNNELKKKSND